MDLGKKAQQNMFWIVIGAVIALVVMIILIVMFTGKTGALEGGLLDCESKGGVCEFSDSAECKKSDNFPKSEGYSGEDGGTVASAFQCSGTNTGNVCCFPPSKVSED